MKPFAIIVSKRAIQEMLDAKVHRLEHAGPAAARDVDDEVAQKFKLLAECPEMGALIRRGRGWSQTDRFLVLDRCHRILYYRADVEAETILVLRFPHEKQRPPRL
jgi:plasmid stabilization system protein ParE